MRKLRKDMDRLFNRLWSDFGVSAFPKEIEEGPYIDLTETDDTLIVTAELPSINPEDVDVSITGNSLTISGEQRRETIKEKPHYLRVERRFGAFSRTVRLPCRVKVEDIRATYKKGVLRITMPKCDPDKPFGVKVEIK
jgi:HSP20 family protein